jgi:hypothetical protein
LDLFTSGPIAEAIPVRAEVLLTDEALIAALPDADLGGTRALTAEAGRRRLAASVPALEALCGRLIGFGSIRVVPEQVAARRAGCDRWAAIGTSRGAADRQGRIPGPNAGRCGRGGHAVERAVTTGNRTRAPASSGTGGRHDTDLPVILMLLEGRGRARAVSILSH